jgi:hypothetical protein
MIPKTLFKGVQSDYVIERRFTLFAKLCNYPPIPSFFTRCTTLYVLLIRNCLIGHAAFDNLRAFIPWSAFYKPLRRVLRSHPPPCPCFDDSGTSRGRPMLNLKGARLNRLTRTAGPVAYGTRLAL